MLPQFIQEMLTLIGALIVVYIVYVFFTRNDDKPATDTPTMAHTALRELVERAVDEARKLPGLGATVSTGLHDDLSFSEQNYEDLLATAILNKVIEKFQSERVDDNSNVLHRRIRSTLANHDNEMGLDEGVEEGSSSLEPMSHDDHSSEESGPRARHIHVRQEPLSLTIEEQIEEVTTTYTSDEELRCTKTNVLDFRNARRVPFPEFGMDIVDPSQDSSEGSHEDDHDLTHVDRITPVESWEENWLFQKRKIQSQSESVAMLVPNPSSDFRALIGDKDAEDTSDLSEFSAQSDDEAEDEEYAEAINRVIPKGNRADNDLSPIFEGVKKIPDLSCTNGANVEESVSNEGRPEVDVNTSSALINRLNKDNECQDKIVETGEKLEAKGSGLLKYSVESVKDVTTNSVIPKTPASSPMRNSLSENTSVYHAGCDVQLLNARLATIDTVIDRATTITELSGTQVATVSVIKTEDKNKKENRADNEVSLSEIKVDRNSQSSTMNGCLKDNSRDTDDHESREVGGSGRRLGVVHNALDKSLKEENKSNGEAKEIKAVGLIANDVSSKSTERKCQALAQAKADSASEKPCLDIEVNENIGLATPPRPGTIAEREHKKWENAAPIENNPYSEENIQKRLLERQYARRSSDVSGSSTKLQTCPSPPLQIVLGAGRPDFRRFGRDYYINEAKFPKGRSIEESGFFAPTSRPNSSLSQHSLSTVSDYEQQVSHGLDSFEEASLRGSLRRRSYRGANATPDFVTNPLVHLDLDQNYNASGGAKIQPSLSSQWKTLEAINSIGQDDLFTMNDGNLEQRETWPLSRHENIESKSVVDILNDATKPFVKSSNESSTRNPLYDGEDEIVRLAEGPSAIDRDSGMYSIESLDLEYCGSETVRDNETKAKDLATRLSWSPRKDENYDGGACTSDGRKYWTFTWGKLNTFGGIKRRKCPWFDQDEDFFNDDVTVARDHESNQDFPNNTDDDFFAGLKFQTFGGIKSDERTKEMSKYRKQRARPSVRSLEGTEVFEDRILSGIFKKSKSRLINSNVSGLSHSRVVTRKSSETKVESSDDEHNLKLEPPEVPVVVHRSFKSLQDLRQGSDLRGKRRVGSRVSGRQ